MKYVSEDVTSWCKHRGIGFSNGFEKKCTSTTNTLVFDNLKEVVGITEIKATNGQDYPSRTNIFFD